MAAPQARLDGYGAPVPDLADARRAVLLERPVNRQVRHELVQALEAKHQALLRRGTNARVVLTFDVQDGVLQLDWSLTVTELHRTIRED